MRPWRLVVRWLGAVAATGVLLPALAERSGAESLGDFLVPVGASWRYLDDGSDQG
jgi:hypothetical protein